jgi:hypothetical protein
VLELIDGVEVVRRMQEEVEEHVLNAGGGEEEAEGTGHLSGMERDEVEWQGDQQEPQQERMGLGRRRASSEKVQQNMAEGGHARQAPGREKAAREECGRAAAEKQRREGVATTPGLTAVRHSPWELDSLKACNELLGGLLQQEVDLTEEHANRFFGSEDDQEEVNEGVKGREVLRPGGRWTGAPKVAAVRHSPWELDKLKAYNELLGGRQSKGR